MNPQDTIDALWVIVPLIVMGTLLITIFDIGGVMSAEKKETLREQREKEGW